MIAFPSILATYAAEAGMAHPEDPDQFEELKADFPHFHIFCVLQLGQPMPNPQAGWDNAKVVADIPLEELKTMTQQHFIDKGFQVGYSQP